MVGIFQFIVRASLPVALLVIVACNSEQQPLPDHIVLHNSEIEVPLPQRLRALQELDLDALRAVATVNGVESPLQLNAAGQFTGQVTVPAQSNVTVRIDFIEVFSGQPLTLARAERNVTSTSANMSLTLLSDDYNYNAFDFDGDGVSNILERQNNTSPVDSEQILQLRDVEVFAGLPATLTTAGFSSYQIIATVDGETESADASAGQFLHLFAVVPQDNLLVEVRVVETVTGQGITVGSQTRRVPVSEDGALVIFNSASWNLEFDQDADGIRDVDELIAGTDLLGAGVETEPNSDSIAYSVTFDIPSEIANSDSVFATLNIDGQSVSLSRVNNSYTASGSAATGATVDLQAQIMDTFQGTAVVIATFSGEAMPVANGTLQLQSFNTDVDTDNDGIANYLELEQGSDPFSAPSQCTPVTDTFAAALTDDAYVENAQIFDNAVLRVETDNRAAVIRFQYDVNTNPGTVTAASLNLTVANDAGDGQLSVFAVSSFDWNDLGDTVVLPTGEQVASVTNEWQAGQVYSFALNPAAITADTTLTVRQQGTDDVAFQSSDGVAPPVLELTVERCE